MSLIMVVGAESGGSRPEHESKYKHHGNPINILLDPVGLDRNVATIR
jgi:hypothetical protein